jgi:hypothetical protein
MIKCIHYDYITRNLNRLKGKEVMIAPHRQAELGKILLAHLSVQEEIVRFRAQLGPLFVLPTAETIWKYTTLRCGEILKHQALLLDASIQYKGWMPGAPIGVDAKFTFQVKIAVQDVMLPNKDS